MTKRHYAQGAAAVNAATARVLETLGSELQRLDGLHHYLVLDQDAAFADFLRARGARSVQSMPVSLDRAINGFLAKNHAAPAAA